MKCWQVFLELDSKGLYQSLGKGKESCFLAFPFSTKRETETLSSCSRATTAKKCTKKRDARAKLLFFIVNLNLLLFLPFSLPSPSKLPSPSSFHKLLNENLSGIRLIPPLPPPTLGEFRDKNFALRKVVIT